MSPGNEELRAFADQRGWIVGHEYVDNDISASKGKTRPQYEALMQAVAAGEYDIILVTETYPYRPRQLEDLIDLAEHGRSPSAPCVPRRSTCRPVVDRPTADLPRSTEGKPKQIAERIRRRWRERGGGEGVRVVRDRSAISGPLPVP